tara:strand:- start:990 stop:1895 length:906 start_codon:yes stop_codon:yes gene_type:complete
MNPETCPFTFEDIQTCKDISFEKVKKDYQQLCNFDALTNPRKFCGNPTLYYYQFRNLINCCRENGKTIKEVFDKPEDIDALWKETIKRNKRDKDPLCSAVDMYECHRINRGAIVFFKASTAKYIYKLFNAKNVLDPTAGWGGRMLGAMSMGINYTGIDTNTNLKEGYNKMMNELWIGGCEKHKILNPEYKMIWESCLEVDYSKLDYDLVLTSPPYINMEIYENCPLFDKKTFYQEFLIPMMNKVFEYLKIDGNMCINISPKMFNDLMKAGYRPPDQEIDLRQQLGKQYKTKSQDLIYVWKK